MRQLWERRSAELCPGRDELLGWEIKIVLGVFKSFVHSDLRECSEADENLLWQVQRAMETHAQEQAQQQQTEHVSKKKKKQSQQVRDYSAEVHVRPFFHDCCVNTVRVLWMHEMIRVNQAETGRLVQILQSVCRTC